MGREKDLKKQWEMNGNDIYDIYIYIHAFL
jgi:hypothetical protein